MNLPKFSSNDGKGYCRLSQYLADFRLQSYELNGISGSETRQAVTYDP